MGSTGLPWEVLLQLQDTIGFLFFLSLLLLLFVVVVARRWKTLAEEEVLNQEKLLEVIGREEEEEAVNTVYGGSFGAVDERVCAVCGGPSSSRCSRCKSVRYCSGNCQIISWRQGHKYECRAPVQLNVPEKGYSAEASFSVKSQITKKGFHDSVPKYREMHLEEYAPGVSSSSSGDFGKTDGADRDSSAGSVISNSYTDSPNITCNDSDDNQDSYANSTKAKSNHSEAVVSNPPHSNAGWNCRISSMESCRDKATEEDHQKSTPHGVSGSYRVSHSASFSSRHPVNGSTLSCTQPRNSGTFASSDSYGLTTSIQKVVRHLRPSKSLNTYHAIFPYELFIKLYNEKVDLHPRGLANMGNSCYANAVLQCLAFSRPLTAYFLQGFHRNSCLRKQWCFTCELENVVAKMKQDKYPLSPTGILSHVNYIGHQLGHGKQEDAHEFLRYAVDAMQSTCPEEATLLQHVFGGYLKSMVTCMRCRRKSERCDRTLDLTIEINGDVWTLGEALQRFTRSEILDGDNKYFCNRCKSYEKATKQLKIGEAPNILTIVMKRFEGGKTGNINKMVDFPQFLNLAPYMCNQNDKAPVYNLYAAIEHLGSTNSGSSGHYISYVKSPQGTWYEADDSLVKSINLEKLLSKQAYILFYERCSPRAPSLSRSLIPKFLSERKKKSYQGSVSCGRVRDHSDISPTHDQYQGFGSLYHSHSSSDISSLLSFSDEGSTSTDSTGDSISVDDYDRAFGDCDSSGSYSPFRFSGESENSTYFTQAYGHCPAGSVDPSRPGSTIMEEVEVLRRLGYDYDDNDVPSSQWYHESSLSPPFDTPLHRPKYQR